MPILIPRSTLDPSAIVMMRADLRDKTQSQVQGTMGGQQTVTRDLAANDISGAASGAARFARLSNVGALVARTWLVGDIIKVLPQSQAVGIYGYTALAAAPLIDMIRFSLGAGAKLAQFVLTNLYADKVSNTAFFDPPLIFRPGQSIGIDLAAESAIAAGAESYMLLGVIAEPAGLNVQVDNSNLGGS